MSSEVESIFNVNRVGEAIEELKNELKKSKNQNEVIKLYNDYMPLFWLGRTLKGVRSFYNDFRKDIKEMDNFKNKEFVLILFSFSSLANSKVMNDYNKKIDTKVTNIDTLEKLNVELIDNKINEIKNLLETNDFKVARNQSVQDVRNYYIVIYLSLVTGGRFIEVMKTLKLHRRGVKIYASGIVKKDGELYEKNFNITVLDDIEVIQQYLRELRKNLDLENMTNKEVSRKYNFIFNRFLKNKVFDLISGITMHDLRAIYAEMCFQKFGKGKMDRTKFFNKVLRHKEVITPAEAYIKFGDKE